MGGVATMDERPVILEVECPEPDGKVVRSVRLGQLSFERLRFLWDKLKDFDVLFNDFVRGDNQFESFINHFVLQVDGEPVPAGLVWDVDDVGILLLNKIKPGVSASAHFVFWDKRFRGREVLCREMLRYCFEKYHFVRIETEIGLYAAVTMKAAERIGFTLEGRKRDATLYHGEWYDVNIYSVIPDDLDDLSEKAKDKPWKQRPTLAVCASCGEKFKPRKLGKVNNGS